MVLSLVMVEQTMTLFRTRMIDDAKVAGLAVETQEVYPQAAGSPAKHYRKPLELRREEEVRRYLLDMRGRNARGNFKTAITASSSFIGARWARAGHLKKIQLPKQKRLSQAHSHAEVWRFLGGVGNPIHRGCFNLIYGCGLRISEAATLPITAIDKTSGTLRVARSGGEARRRWFTIEALDSGFEESGRRSDSF